MALDRALEADPRYSMALLLRDTIDAGTPPSLARLPMTPEEVAASYAADDERAAAGADGPPGGDPDDDQAGRGPGRPGAPG